MTNAADLEQKLREWKCPACGGTRIFKGYSKGAVYKAEDKQPCRECVDTDGLHPIAFAALRDLKGVVTEYHLAGVLQMKEAAAEHFPIPGRDGYLDRCKCGWIADKYPKSMFADWQAHIRNLPLPPADAEALYKWRAAERLEGFKAGQKVAQDDFDVKLAADVRSAEAKARLDGANNCRIYITDTAPFKAWEAYIDVLRAIAAESPKVTP